MKKTEFKKLVTELYRLNKEGKKWIDSIPYEISSGYFDNPYVSAIQQQVDVLMKTLFVGTLSDDVFWYLYDWKEGGSKSSKTITLTSGTEFVINNIDDYCDYLAHDEVGLIEN